MKLGIGKLYSNELQEYCLQHLPLADALGGHRPDYSSIQGGSNLCIATDPVIGVPLDTYGYFAVHYSAGDLACSGVDPEFLNLGIYLPPESTSEWLSLTCTTLGNEAKRQGMKVLGGHTGVYHGLTQPLISTTSIGFRQSKHPIPQKPQEHDQILLAGAYGFEFVWYLSYIAPHLLRNSSATVDIDQIRTRINALDVITPSKLAWKYGAHFIHDITEGGLSSALLDLSRFGELNPLVNVTSIVWDSLSEKMIAKIGGDALSTSSFGCILIVTPPSNVDNIVSGFTSKNIPVSVIGEMTAGAGPIYYDGDQKRPITLGTDPYTHLTLKLT